VSADASYRLGIDVGSKTIKLVILDEDGAVLLSQYRLRKVLGGPLEVYSQLVQAFRRALGLRNS
jgi:activator of 2-hydroxyglutaryl-CoA dehydratase